jgi:hypothetical protein
MLVGCANGAMEGKEINNRDPKCYATSFRRDKAKCHTVTHHQQTRWHTSTTGIAGTRALSTTTTTTTTLQILALKTICSLGLTATTSLL